jgi:hypothetical protein
MGGGKGVQGCYNSHESDFEKYDHHSQVLRRDHLEEQKSCCRHCLSVDHRGR